MRYLILLCLLLSNLLVAQITDERVVFENDTLTYTAVSDGTPVKIQLVGIQGYDCDYSNSLEIAPDGNGPAESLIIRQYVRDRVPRFSMDAATVNQVQIISQGVPRARGVFVWNNPNIGTTSTTGSFRRIDAASTSFSPAGAIISNYLINMGDQNGRTGKILSFEVAPSNRWLMIPIHLTGAVNPNQQVPILAEAITPMVPDLVLHDPPGDGSYSGIVVGNEYCINNAYNRGGTEEFNASLGFKIGVKGSAGLFVTVDYEIYSQTTAGISSEQWSVANLGPSEAEFSDLR